MTERGRKYLKRYQKESIEANDFYNVMYGLVDKPNEWFQGMVVSNRFFTLGDPKFDVACELFNAFMKKRKLENQIDRMQERIEELKNDGENHKKIKRLQESIAQKNNKIKQLRKLTILVDEEEASYHL